MDETCATCRFWRSADGSLGPLNGECHRRPPLTVETHWHAGSLYSGCAFPRVSSAEWCGEWTRRKIKKAGVVPGSGTGS
jgi:hypothetical protein